MQIYYSEGERRLFLAFILSMLLHLTLFISTQLRFNFSWLQRRQEVSRPADIIRFDLIKPEPPLVMETPQTDKEEMASKPSNIISDKDAAAKDMLDKSEDFNEMPYAEGRSKIKELEKSIPSPASIPREEVRPQPEVKQAESADVPPSAKGEEKTGIEMLSPEDSLSRELLPQELLPAQKEQVASIPKDIFRIPLYEDKLSNARGFGEVAFSAKKHDVAPYIIKMKKKIEQYWAPPVLFTYYGLTSGETVVQFKIMPDGQVKDIKVIQEKGDESLKKSSVQAIMDASPFDPIPPQILDGEKEKYLGITFSFYYVIDKPAEEDI